VNQSHRGVCAEPGGEGARSPVFRQFLVLGAIAASGAELIVLTPLFDHAEQLERIAADLAPRLS
jgi:hypothetical protein